MQRLRTFRNSIRQASFVFPVVLLYAMMNRAINDMYAITW